MKSKIFNFVNNAVVAASFICVVTLTSCSKEDQSQDEGNFQIENATTEQIIKHMSDSFDLNGALLVSQQEYNSYPKIEMDEVINLGEGNLESRSSYLRLPTVPVGNQGTKGSCVAFAVGYLGSTYVLKVNKNYLVEARSPEYLYNSTKIPGDCSTGTYMANAMNFLMDKGICGWSRMPYSDKNGCFTKPNADQLAYGLYGRLTSWRTFDKSVENIKIVLNSKLPVLVSMDLHQSFYDQTLKTPFTFRSVSGKYVGGHAFNIVGYNEAKKVFICQNSWGTGYHDKGLFYIAYSLIPNLFMELYILHPEVNLSGRWRATGYQCEGKTIQEEIIEIDHKGTNLRAKKITGDLCVPAGKITFEGQIFNKGVNENITFTTGIPSKPACCKAAGKLNFKDGIISLTSSSNQKIILYPIQ